MVDINSSKTPYVTQAQFYPSVCINYINTDQVCEVGISGATSSTGQLELDI